jgi:predicted RND superfamily exporter protein
MVQGFGLLLVAGIFLAFACALTAGFAALVRFSDRRPRDSGVPPLLPRTREVAGRWLDAARNSRPVELVTEYAALVWAWLVRRGRQSLQLALERPRQVLAVGLLVAALGWVADTQTEVISDVRQLVPQDLQALKDVNTLQHETGVSGEVDVTVRAKDVTDPAVVRWMVAFQEGVLTAHGYRQGSSCAQSKNPPDLCPALSLPELFSSSSAGSRQQIRGLLDSVPHYFSQGVVSNRLPDGSRRVANLAFGIRFQSLASQKKLIDDVKRRLHPPPGVTARVAGLPVLAADANASLSSAVRRALTLLAGLALVFLVLLLVRRRVRAAAVPLIPIALATGWSALVLFLIRIPLNPMSATLGALVIAISTEFSVLLSSRYDEERKKGAGPRSAIELAYGSTGAAVLASGTTAIAGFAALIASDIRMLRDFGIVTVVDLTVSLLGVMIVLPAALLWAEEHGPFTLRDLDPRPAVRAIGRAIKRVPAGLRAAGHGAAAALRAAPGAARSTGAWLRRVPGLLARAWGALRSLPRRVRSLTSRRSRV